MVLLDWILVVVVVLSMGRPDVGCYDLSVPRHENASVPYPIIRTNQLPVRKTRFLFDFFLYSNLCTLLRVLK